jgi:hypothetical protein
MDHEKGYADHFSAFAIVIKAEEAAVLNPDRRNSHAEGRCQRFKIDIEFADKALAIFGRRSLGIFLLVLCEFPVIHEYFDKTYDHEKNDVEGTEQRLVHRLLIDQQFEQRKENPGENTGSDSGRNSFF